MIKQHFLTVLCPVPWFVILHHISPLQSSLCPAQPLSNPTLSSTTSPSCSQPFCLTLLPASPNPTGLGVAAGKHSVLKREHTAAGGFLLCSLSLPKPCPLQCLSLLHKRGQPQKNPWGQDPCMCYLAYLRIFLQLFQLSLHFSTSGNRTLVTAHPPSLGFWGVWTGQHQQVLSPHAEQ